MSKKIFKTAKEKQKFFDGIKDAADCIVSTMGAQGKTVIYSRGHGSMPIASKDGVTITREMFPDDELECMGAALLKDAGNATVNIAGDGTTATALMLSTFALEGNKCILNGAKPQFVKKGIDIAVKEVVRQIALMADPIGEDNNKILNVATISANNDKEIGKLIADAYKEIGNNGLLTVEKSQTSETFTTIVQGFEFNRGYIDPCYINNFVKRIAVFENPKIFITDHTISSSKDLKGIAPVLDAALEAGGSIVVICTDIDQVAHYSMVQNRIKSVHAGAGIKVCFIKATNTYKEQLLSDIAVLTGGTVLSDKAGLKLYQLKPEHLGECEKIIVTDKTTTIIGGKGETINIIRRKEEIATMIETAIGDAELQKVHEKRLAQVCGSVAVIHVGATTDVEQKEKYDRTDDAVRAVKSAIEEGVVVGGGVAMLRCIDAMETLKINTTNYDNSDVLIGIDIVKFALEEPLRQMVRNAGVFQRPLKKLWNKIFGISEEESILKKVKEAKGNIGYNVKTSRIEDLKESGIIDAAKVLRVALLHAASVAGAILTTEYFLVEMKNPTNK